MNRKTIIILGSCFLFATVLMVTLYATTRKIVREHNSFLREYSKSFLAKKVGELDIEFNSFYLAGISKNEIYLTSVTVPFNLLIIDHNLKNAKHVKLRIKGVENPTVHLSSIVKIDPPYFYLADGMEPAIYKGRIGEWIAEKIDYDSIPYFTQIVPVGKTSLAIRTNKPGSREKILGKVQRNPRKVHLESSLLQKQVDGIFCTDGMLLYNKDLKRLVYTYYYRNEFIVSDTNLNLDYRGHSIDTFSRAQIKVGHITSEKSLVLLDKKFVNIQSSTSGNYLFMRSSLLARNDPDEQLKHSAIIDVYDIRNNTYQFSFKLRDRDGKRVRDFMVFDDKMLIALFDHYIVKYEVNPE